MRRRSFIKSGVGLSTAIFFNRRPFNATPFTLSHNSGHSNYQPNDEISKNAFVQSRDLEEHTLVDLCREDPEPKINMLYICGGGANGHRDRLGDIWCPDTFEDLHTLRFVHEKYEASDVRIIPVACPPVYSSHYYGFDRKVFLDESDDSPKFRESVQTFIESTEEVVGRKYLPVQTYYDLRFRLLFNIRQDLRPGDSYGPIYDWQGKFRGANETQKYGTPSIWLLDSRGRVLEKPFWGNVYHSKPFEIRYTVLDLDKAIKRNL